MSVLCEAISERPGQVPWLWFCEIEGPVRNRENGGGTITLMFHDMRAAFFLIIALAMLLFICALAGLGAVLQPARWSDRNVSR